MTSTPALRPLDLPSDPGGWLGFVTDRCAAEFGRAGEDARRLRTLSAEDPDGVLRVWNDIAIALSNGLSVASLLSEVHPDPAVREQAEAESVRGRTQLSELMLDPALYGVLSAVNASTLDAEARRVLEHSLRDFRRAGVDRDDAVRDRLHRLEQECTDLEQAFQRNVREDQRSTLVPISAVTDLPQDWREAHPVDDDAMVSVTTQYPDTLPFLSYSGDREARRAVMTTFQSIGWPANDAVLRELFDLRHERATLLGYDDWPSYDAETKMIGSGPAIAEFIDQIAADAQAPGQRDLEVLVERARRDDPSLSSLTVADSRYYAELVRRENFEVDTERVRTYFAFEKVRDGLLEVTGRLFGLQFSGVDTAVWHDEVSAYDVDLDGEPLGRIYLDLHPRDGKFRHAAQFGLVGGIRGRQLPEGVLVCNFPRSLMEHSDVVTLFHEFGHLVHHLLAGRATWQRFSGVSTEWDFVEAPSQMLEEWAWDAEVLRSFATNDAGEPLPTKDIERMRAANLFGQGYLTRTQMFYAAISYRFHRERPSDLDEYSRELHRRYHVFDPLPNTHFHTGFGHLVGYGSGYYTYMWSLIIAKDLFSAFEREDLFAPDVARSYRDTILVPGGSRDAADLVRDFLGRPYDSRAFRAWLSGESR